MIQAMRNLGPMRLTIMGGAFLGMVFFFIYITSKMTSPNYDLLYADLDQKDSSKIVQILTTQKIPYEIAQGGGTIMIPADEIPRLRIQLADQGIPGGGTLGYELFDDQDGLGTTNFMQNVNLVRALEGELARTIQSIANISSARVHLVLPKRELFSRERQEPSASVILNMSGGKRLEKEQIMSVQYLVATAVPSLNPNKISIVDNKGKLLAAGYEDEDDVSIMSDKTDNLRRKFENRMSRQIEELLEQTVGFGNVRVQVNASLDFDRVTSQEEIYDPDGQVVRSTSTSDQSSSASDSEGATPVTVDANLPDAGFTSGEGISSQASDAALNETVNFEISKKVVNHVREIGTVNRLSVAVLINDFVINAAEDEAPIFEQRSTEQMELLSTLVRGAIGFDADRGDVVEMINLRFADSGDVEEKLELFFGMDKNDLLRLAEFLVLGIVAILVILLVVRPLISRAIESLPSADMLAGERLLADQTAAQALSAPGAPIPGGALGGDVEQFEELIDIDRVEGRVKASSVKKVGEIVEKHPEEALSIIRNWMYQES